jgi:RecA-family ATPase
MLRGLAMRLDAAVVMIAHPSVDGIRTGRGYSGSTHWNNAVRSRLTFTTPADDHGRELDPDLRVLELAKSNRARRGEKVHMRWEEGCFSRVAAGAVVDKASDHQDDTVFLELMGKFAAEGRNVSSNSKSPTFAPAAFIKRPQGKEIGKPRLDRAMERLLESGTLRVVTEGPASHQRSHLVVTPPVAGPTGAPGLPTGQGV